MKRNFEFNFDNPSDGYDISSWSCSNKLVDDDRSYPSLYA